MKKKMLMLVMCLLIAGCGTPLANIGGGVAAGSVLSGTITGMNADLERREASLIRLYNEGVEAGAQKETLEQIEQAIYDTRLGRQAMETGETLLGVNWNNPKETGGAIGLLATLAYGYWKRKELATLTLKYSATKKGVNRFLSESKEIEARSLYQAIGEERAAAKV